jgi:hypothetical protein
LDALIGQRPAAESALPGEPPVSGPENAAAVFCNGAFVAVIEKKPGAENRWSYGYVNAGA